MKNKLSFKLAFVFLIIFIIPLLAFGIISLKYAQKAAVSAINVRALKEVKQASARIRSYVENVEMDLVTIASNISDIGLEDWQAEAILEANILNNNRIICITLISESQTTSPVSCSKSFERKFPTVSTIEKTIRGKRFYKSDVEIGDHEPFITFAVNVPNRNNEGIFLIAQVSLLDVWSAVDSLVELDFANAFLVNKSGELIAHSNSVFKPEILSKVSWQDLNVVKRVLGGEDAVSSEKSRLNEESFFVGTPIDSLGWGLFIEQPTKIAFKDVYFLRTFLIVTIIAILLLIFPVAVYAGKRNILNPVKSLMQSTKVIGTGNFSKPVESLGSDELGMLGNSIDLMRQKLEEFKDKIEADARISFFSEVAAGLAHDLKHPVTNIKILTESLPDNKNDDLFFKRYLNVSQKELVKMENYLNDLNALGRPLKPNAESIDLKTTISAFFDQYRTFLNEKDISLSLDLPKGIAIVADNQLLDRVFSNLTINAVHAMASGGNIAVACLKHEEIVHITFADTGSGINPDILRTLFTGFKSTKRNGLGIGLALTKRFIEEMKGNISVETELGKGTTFTLKFPVSASPQEQA